VTIFFISKKQQFFSVWRFKHLPFLKENVLEKTHTFFAVVFFGYKPPSFLGYHRSFLYLSLLPFPLWGEDKQLCLCQLMGEGNGPYDMTAKKCV
jgi:hypothetical protein